MATYHLKGLKPVHLNGVRDLSGRTEVLYANGVSSGAYLRETGSDVFMEVTEHARDSPASLGRFVARRLGGRASVVPTGH